jgi:hypothetical protein
VPDRRQPGRSLAHPGSTAPPARLRIARPSGMGEHHAVASGWLDGKASAHAARAGTRTALEIAAFSDPAAPRTGCSAVLSPANWEFMKPFVLGDRELRTAASTSRYVIDPGLACRARESMERQICGPGVGGSSPLAHPIESQVSGPVRYNGRAAALGSVRFDQP